MPTSIIALSGLTFCSCTSTKEIEKIQKWYLRILLDDYESYYNALLEKNGKSTIEVK